MSHFDYDDFDPFEGQELYECKTCERDDLYEHEFPKRKGNYVIKKCLSCIASDRREKRRAFKRECIAYKGGHCVQCQYYRCQDALEFHHLDPNEKDFMVSEVQHTSLERVKDELDKCVLLCSNCHKEIHAGYPLPNV